MALSDLVPTAAKDWLGKYVSVTPAAPAAVAKDNPTAAANVFGNPSSGYRAPSAQSPLKDLREVKPQERKEAIHTSRILRAKLGIIKALFENTARYSLGSGLEPTSQCTDPEWRVMADEIFRVVSSSPNFDVREELPFKEMQGLVLPDVICDGDAGAAPTRGPEGDPRLQLFSSEAIGDCAGPSPFDRLGTWQEGIMRNDVGAKVAVRILKNQQLGQRGTRRSYFDYEANQFHLIGRPDRINGNRSLPWLYHGDQAAIKIMDLHTLEMAARQLNSYFTAAVKTRSGNLPNSIADLMSDTEANVVTEAAEDEGDAVPAQTPEEQMEQMARLEQRVIDLYGAGAILPLEKDQEFQFFKNDRDSTSTTEFINYLIMDIATGFGCPPQFIWGTTGLAGPYARMILQQADWFFTSVADMMVTKFCQPVWEGIIQDAMTPTRLPNGRVLPPILRAPAPGSNWRAVQWQGPGSMTIDKGRDGRLYLEMIKAGIGRRSTWNQMTGKGGMSECYAAIDELKELIKYCNDAGVPPEYYFGQEFAANGISAPADGTGLKTEELAAAVVALMSDQGLVHAA